MAHYMNDDLAVKAGLNISKNTDNFGLNFNLEFNEQNGLKDSQVSISLTKVIQNNISKKTLGEIEKYLKGLNKETIEIPYTTNVWVAQSK